MGNMTCSPEAAPVRLALSPEGDPNIRLGVVLVG